MKTKELYKDESHIINMYAQKGYKTEVVLIDRFSGEQIQIDRFPRKEKPQPVGVYLAHTKKMRESKMPFYTFSEI